jgi:hypothetical protein
MIAKGCSLRNSDLPAPYEGEADILAIYEYVPSTKTQNEENRAVMGRELLWAMCGFQRRGHAPRWGTYEGVVKADLEGQR